MKERVKRFIKKIFFVICGISVDEDSILTVKDRCLFVNRVALLSKQDKIILHKGKNHVIDLKTVMNLNEYNISFYLSLFFIKFYMKLPIKISSLLNESNMYIKAMNSFPLDNKLIIFESFFGKNYSGQPKYIYEYLLSLDLPFKYVWVYQKSNHDIPGNPTIVKRGSPDYYKYLATAKYWVNNIVFPVEQKRDETIYLQTWHGTPLKRLGFDIEVSGPEVDSREKFYKESRNWDYLITQNSYTSKILKRAFKFDKEIIELGYPHNDILVTHDQNRVKKIKEALNIPFDKKVLLYAPTWRDNDMNGAWSFDFSLKIDLKKWQKTLGNEYVLLIRMHHLISKIKGLDEVQGFVYNVSNYDDVQELNFITDILITDYSSVFFDFAVTKRPILFYAYDLEEYASKLRGFYLDMEKDMPGPIVKTDEALLKAIVEIEKVKEDYSEKYTYFSEKFCYLDQGDCARKVVERVFKEIND